MRTQLLVMTALIALATGAHAQELYPPPGETPAILAPPNTLPPPPPPLGSSPPILYQDTPPVVMDAEVMPRRMIGGRPGWRFDLDLALLFPDVRFRNEANTMFGNSADFDLNPGIAGTLTVGYLFEGPHAMYFAYRGFDARGNPDSDFANEEIRTGVELNDFDWVYQRRFGSDSSRFRVAAEVGIRLTSLQYSYSIHSHYPLSFLADEYVHNTSTWCNEFVGAGPTIGLSDEFAISPAISFFSRADFGVLFGEQRVRTKYRTSLPWVDSMTTSYSDREGHDVKVLRAMAGVNWMPPSTPRMSFQLGYQFEYWWQVGKFGDASDDIMLNGLFGRIRFIF
jgi:hypothetical protein